MSAPYQLIPLAAPDAKALDAISLRVAGWLERTPDVGLADLGYSLALARAGQPQRRAVFARDRAEAIAVLRAPPPKTTITGNGELTEPAVGFLLPGPSNEPGLEEIYDTEPTFKQHFDVCAEIMERTQGFDLRPFLKRTSDTSDSRTLCFLFAVEYALCALWRHWGVRPSVLMGYSFGELVAACVAGVFELNDALALAYERSRLLETLPRGAMTAVALSEADARSLLSAGVEIAIHRGPTSCVVSGSTEAVAAFEASLRKADIAHQRLGVPFSGHSPEVERIAGPFTRAVERTLRRAPALPIISNVTGRVLTDECARSGTYWAEQLRRTVQFAPGLQAMLDAGCRVVLEVGPGHHLTSLASQQIKPSAGILILPTLRNVIGEPSTRLGILRSVARLWSAGLAIDWSAFYSGPARRRISPAAMFD